MDKHFPVSQFDGIYLIDLCGPLLDVARRWFSRKGWRNITVLCQDGTEFSLPKWSTTDPKGSVNFITPSYCLFMVSASLLPFIRSTKTSFRFQASMPSSIASTTSSLPRRGYSVSSTFTPQGASLRFTIKPSEAPARSVVGSVVGSGRYGSTLTACPCPIIDATASSTSLARYVQHARFAHALCSHVYRQVKIYNGRNRFIAPFIVRM